MEINQSYQINQTQEINNNSLYATKSAKTYLLTTLCREIHEIVQQLFFIRTSTNNQDDLIESNEKLNDKLIRYFKNISKIINYDNPNTSFLIRINFEELIRKDYSILKNYELEMLQNYVELIYLEHPEIFRNPRFQHDLIPLAIQNHHQNAVKSMVLFGAHVNSPDSEGYYLIHIAAKHGLKELVELLVMKGALVDQINWQGSTPLHLAIKKRNISIAHLLLMVGANPNIRNNKGYSSLHFAAKKGISSLIKPLLKHGALIDQRAHRDHTPLTLACSLDQCHFANTLLQHGAKPDLLDSTGLNAYSYMKLHAMKIDQISDGEDDWELAKEVHWEMRYRKFISNLFSFEGETTLQRKIKYEGSFGQFSRWKFIKLFKKFLTRDPCQKDLIEDTYSLLKDHYFGTEKVDNLCNLTLDFDSGDPLIFLTGPSNHLVFVAIFRNYLLISNAGYGHRRGLKLAGEKNNTKRKIPLIKAYKIDRENCLEVGAAQLLQLTSDLKGEGWVKFLYVDLPLFLGATNLKEGDYITEAFKTIEQPPQKTGNCWIKNVEIGILSLFAIQKMLSKTTDQFEDDLTYNLWLSEQTKEAHQLYKFVTNFFRAEIISSYLKKCIQKKDEKSIPPDLKLIEMVKNKILSYQSHPEKSRYPFFEMCQNEGIIDRIHIVECIWFSILQQYS